jgi:large subunit ribosomal protein L30
MIIKVKRIRSIIGCNPKQRKVIAALGLRRMHMVKEFKDNAAVRGMIAKVPHMVEVVQ